MNFPNPLQEYRIILSIFSNDGVFSLRIRAITLRVPQTGTPVDADEGRSGRSRLKTRQCRHRAC